MLTFKLLLAISIIKKWHTLQLDINNTFLNGDHHEEVYMTLPKSLIVPSSTCVDNNLIFQLHKSIYGLRQSSRQWYKKLSDALIREGFKQSHVDYALFTGSDDTYITLLVYVNDIIIIGPNLTLLH
uniref:Reverse transcriptase Ty1/copia-type domain-containing protein n=1 Tax=Cannabis sativa TaxID=3483 RepID=A0A803NZV1_CANSA